MRMRSKYCKGKFVEDALAGKGTYLPIDPRTPKNSATRMPDETAKNIDMLDPHIPYMTDLIRHKHQISHKRQKNHAVIYGVQIPSRKVVLRNHMQMYYPISGRGRNDLSIRVRLILQSLHCKCHRSLSKACLSVGVLLRYSVKRRNTI